jgi:predicted phosphohydrolase
MKIWAIADLHLSGNDPTKKMDRFGSTWKNHADKIADDWNKKVSISDIVLLAGDISWASKLPRALPDLEWISTLPGHKVLLKGNHDYWWPSTKKLRENLPQTMYAVCNDVVQIEKVAIAGTRLWDSPEYNFLPYIDIKDEGKGLTTSLTEEDKSRFDRELIRLEKSLELLPQEKEVFRIAMTHYPPVGAEMQPSHASKLLEKYNVEQAIFGHLHSVRENSLPFGTSRGVTYHLTSCDYLQFKLKLIASC